MSQLSYDDEDYYFQISDELESDKEFVLYYLRYCR